MYYNRLFRAPVSCAARNPTAKSRRSREPRDQACMLIVSPQNLTGNSAELLPWCLSNLRAPRDPTKSCGGTTARPAEKDPDVLRVEMSAKANLPLAQTPPPTSSDARQKYHVTSAVHNIPSFASMQTTNSDCTYRDIIFQNATLLVIVPPPGHWLWWPYCSKTSHSCYASSYVSPRLFVLQHDQTSYSIGIGFIVQIRQFKCSVFKNPIRLICD